MSHKDEIILHFQKFPGIGPKQAERFAYFLMKQNKGFVDAFTNSLQNIKQNSRQCIECFAWYSIENNVEKNLCTICSNINRNKKQIIIVEKELDINAIEKTSEYDGVYFVLGGKLPFLADDPREHIRIRELVASLSQKIKAGELEEVIFALPATDEGDHAVEYIKKTISQIVGFENVIVSTLARGVSTGLEMEYIDHDTFKYAFTARK
jgi:recombination protein RecR